MHKTFVFTAHIVFVIRACLQLVNKMLVLVISGSADTEGNDRHRIIANCSALMSGVRGAD